MASVALVSLGDLVTANQADALATVTRLDPIDVDVYAPSVRMLEVIGDIAGGQLRGNGRRSRKLPPIFTRSPGLQMHAAPDASAPAKPPRHRLPQTEPLAQEPVRSGGTGGMAAASVMSRASMRNASG
ncbi:hypothetical protein NYQ83_04185 [Afifella sp. JA880]|uniref:hypothetical protein n=1 Tax=Afifella sp. JA880 TaxID=2975280 RepID=UPI0021BA668D|nr:hypothetical protein [Afifella sp. JA880]MCT8266464.1 hypothetical protein [Afifella sp. JA880]